MCSATSSAATWYVRDPRCGRRVAHPCTTSHAALQVYFPELLAPLLRSLLQLSSPPFAGPTHPRVVLAYKIRSLAKETQFWAAFGLWFEFAPVLARRGAGDGARWERFGAAGDAGDDGDVFVFVARRRPESLAWEVPTDDTELLGGVGARGDAQPKGDDTFETLLLMGLASDE